MDLAHGVSAAVEVEQSDNHRQSQISYESTAKNGCKKAASGSANSAARVLQKTC
ncbi:hypothetical protein [Paraburkholderia sp. BCC1876]|uniref:hypothetical protein n=1 Tax=Paraburkholderia sp. BCC1876 TaxID=2676303 RepID=UPI001591A761|nr:hypothetical protein [Paraburkholderia sp. BCC1876]